MNNQIKAVLTIIVFLQVAIPAKASDLWQNARLEQFQARGLVSNGAKYFTANDSALRDLLAQAPHENTGDRSHYLQLPMPDGELAQFAVVESPIITPAEAALWPEVKTFRVFGIDNPHASGRVSITSLGFHGLVRTSNDWVFIDPQDFTSQNRLYKSRFKSSASAPTFKCEVEGSHDVMDHSSISNRGYASRMPGSLLEYNFAVAVTLEYHNFFGGTLSNTVSAVTMTVNRVNTIYESDLGIRLILIGTTGEIYEQAESGLLDNENAFALLGVVSNWIDTRLPGGNLAYDIGHMFSQPTFGGGVANLGVTCDNAFKARGVTGLPNPSGDVFDIDFVAHEIGHQFSAEHSFNGTTSSCINRNAATAYEPGSGSTIMGYAGICAAENLQSFSEATFHAGSIDQIDTYAWGGAGFACATQMANGNSDPTIGTPTTPRTIPINTPFILDNTSAVDLVDGDPLSYQWDQLDAGLATNSATFGTDLGDNALFRSYAPRTVSFRNFPALSTQLNNESDDSEVLPCSSRSIDLRLTVRDGNSGQVSDDVRVTADTGSGPFRVSSQATAANIVPNSGAVKIDWEVAKTNSAPVSCPNVVIELLTFNPARTTYSVQPMVVGGLTANDGSEQVTLPDISNSVSRIRVRCSNNIFYDISNADLNIQGTTAITTYDIPVALANPATSPSTAADACVQGELAFSSATYSGQENNGAVTVAVNRTNGSDGAVSVEYATSDGNATAGSDYTAASGTLNFAHGITSQTFSVPLLDDTLVEPDETVNLTLSNVVGATIGVQGSAVLTITDNDVTSPALSLVSPVDGATDLGTSVTFVWKIPISPSGGVLSYQFFLCEDQGLVGCVPTVVALAEKVIDYAGAEGLLPLAFFGTVLGGIGLRRRKWLRGGFLSGIYLLGVLGIVASGGGGGGGGGPAPTDEKSHTVSGLKPGTTYYWKVTASDGIDTVESATWSFTTL